MTDHQDFFFIVTRWHLVKQLTDDTPRHHGRSHRIEAVGYSIYPVNKHYYNNSPHIYTINNQQSSSANCYQVSTVRSAWLINQRHCCMIQRASGVSLLLDRCRLLVILFIKIISRWYTIRSELMFDMRQWCRSRIIRMLRASWSRSTRGRESEYLKNLLRLLLHSVQTQTCSHYFQLFSKKYNRFKNLTTIEEKKYTISCSFPQ